MRSSRQWRAIGVVAFVVLGGLTVVSRGLPSGAENDPTCSWRYVAGGDAVTFGYEAESDDTESETARYSRKLLDDHIRKANLPGCEYNTSQKKVTTKTYVEEDVFEGHSQLAAAWYKDPRLITLTLGRQNDTIVDHVDKCFKQVKDHDFLEANACALAVYANEPVWTQFRKDLNEILNTYRIQQDGAPTDLIIAVTGYFNPYPAATDVATKIPGFCALLVDTIPTCIARWVLLPPALVTLDQVVQKLNTSIEEVVKPFHVASQGRFVFVNPYEKFKSHCMKMNVKIETTVYHPTNTTHDHNTNDTNFGCTDPWVATDHTDGQKSPFLYLTPAVTGVLIKATQKTKDMGIYPNPKGHECIADLIWEATKLKLGVPEKPEDPCT